MEIATPVAFDAMPNGSVVTKRILKQTTHSCSVSANNDIIGLKINVLTGIKQVNQAHNVFNHYILGSGQYNESIKIYTIPELELRGLGFVLSYSSLRHYVRIKCLSGTWKNVHPLNNSTVEMPLTEQSVIWSNVPDCNATEIHIITHTEIYLVKIGNSSQHATLPQNFSVTLFSFSLHTQSAPTIPVLTINHTWSISNFAANVKVRTCTTPTASESLINLGHYQQGDIQSKAAGTVLAQRDFTFTFVCPRKRYKSISFLVEPMYGISPMNSTYPGTMNIAPGAGMAQGVGVQLWVRVPPDNSPFWNNPSWRSVVYRTDPLSNAGGYMSAAGKYPLFLSFVSGNNETSYYLEGDESPTIQRTVNFQARLIRLPGALQPGQIKAAALIHIRYN